MRVVIRVDASIKIGTGHVMRCLTLADALRDNGNEVYFICRRHEGNLIDFIESKKYQVFTLAVTHQTSLHSESDELLAHAHWLGATQKEDSGVCKPIVVALQPDWIIVDHYALDYRWQEVLQEHTAKLLVIDDLADRKHSCQLLLDQTFGRQAKDYKPLVPETCTLLLGSQYALLRPEFSQWRDFSLKRRAKPEFKKLLISLGGVDAENVTSRVLEAVNDFEQLKDVDITVVMGPTSPHLVSVQRLVEELPFNIKVTVNVSDMAELMANSDLAIGAAGATTWERCCLGLPSILLVVADNQRKVAETLSKEKIVEVLSISKLPELGKSFSMLIANLPTYSAKAERVTDGKGRLRVLECMGIVV